MTDSFLSQILGIGATIGWTYVTTEGLFENDLIQAAVGGFATITFGLGTLQIYLERRNERRKLEKYSSSDTGLKI